MDIVECTAAFGYWLKEKGGKPKIVIGRDARISGGVVSALVSNTLVSMGIDVVDLGLSTTPTVEMMVPAEGAGAGIIITASHNPKHWNALKFVNEKGEFISKTDGEAFLELLKTGSLEFAAVDHLGTYTLKEEGIPYHIDQILALPEVLTEAIKTKKFKVVLDACNSTGAISIPPLLEKVRMRGTSIK